MRHLTRAPWGTTLALRSIIARERLAGRTINGAEILSRALAGRIPTGDFADLERRLVTRTGSVGIGESPLTESEIAQFVADLSRVSSFDVVLAATMPLPLRTRVAYLTAGMVGEVVLNGFPKVHARFELDAAALVPIKAVALVIVEDFFANIAVTDAGALLERELTRALGRETDAEFVALIRDPAPPSAASTGSLLPDLALALASLPVNSAARLFALASPLLLRQIATASSDGEQLFPDFDAVLGGRISGVTFVPNDALEVDSGGESDLVLLDATQLAMAADPPTVSMSNEATVDLGTPTMNAATGAGTTATSLWQVNAQGWLSERRFSARTMRGDAVFIVEGASYGAIP